MGQSWSSDRQAEGSTHEGSLPRLYIEVDRDKWPIIYSGDYNISFLGLERIHPFDSGKWGRVFQLLVKKGLLKGAEDVVKPLEASRDDLAVVHSSDYLDSLNVRKLDP